MAYNEEVTMMMSVVPGAMTGISAMMGGLASITNVFTDVTRQIDAKFGLIDASIVTASTIVAQFGLSAAEAFGNFEQGLKIAQMVSNQTAEDMDYLKNKANEFSVSYRTDIDQITEGLQTLGRAGLNSAAEQSEVLREGLSTAKLESRDLNGVLEELIQNTALLGGNLKESNFGEDSKYVNDLLVATSMTAPITTHDVSETLKYSGGIAAAAGAQIRDEMGNVNESGKAILEDYMGAIAAFAQKGVTGSIAGTALRAFFNKPATQDESVKDALASIKLKPEYLWEEDEDTMKPVSEQIAIIKNQMDDLNISTMDQLQIWSKIVGGKMGQQMMKLDSSDIKELTKDIQSSSDAGSLAAGTFETYHSKMKEMTEQGQVAFRQFGEYAAKTLTPLLEILKQILGIFSNPFISGMAFVGAFSLITSAIRRAKDMLSTFSAEIKTFMHYITTGEKLWAMRPSTERKNNRFTPKELERKYPGVSPVMAYSKEKQLEADEKLLAKGFSMEEVNIMRAGARLPGSNFLKDKSFSMFRTDKNSEVIDFLIKNKLWEEKFSETFYQYKSLNKVLEVHEAEITRILREAESAMKPVAEKSTTNTVKNKAKEVEDKVAEARKERIKQLANSDFHFLDENLSAFPEQEWLGEISRGQSSLYAQKKNPAHHNLAFKENRNLITSRFTNAFANNIVATLPQPIGYYLTGDPETGTVHDILSYLIDTGKMPADGDVVEGVKKALEERAEEQVANFLETQYNKLKVNMEEAGVPMSAVALSSRDQFARYTSDIKLDYNVSPDDFQRYVLQSALGITSPNQVLNATQSMLPGFGPSLSLAEIEKLYFSGREYSKEHKEWIKEHRDTKGDNYYGTKDKYYGIDGDGGVYGNTIDNKENRKLKEDMDNEIAEKRRNFHKSTQKELDKRVSEITQMQRDSILKSISPDFEYYNFKELTATNKSALNKISEGKSFLSIKNLRKMVKDIYGQEIELPSRNRFAAAQNALPYFVDWNLDKKAGGITKKELEEFAKKTFGISLDSSKTKKQMVNTLESALYGDKIDSIMQDRQIQAAIAHTSFLPSQELYDAIKEEYLGSVEYEGEILAIDQQRLQLEEEMLLTKQRDKADYLNSADVVGPDIDALNKYNLVEQARQQLEDENQRRDNLFNAHRVRQDLSKDKEKFGFKDYADLEDYYLEQEIAKFNRKDFDSQQKSRETAKKLVHNTWNPMVTKKLKQYSDDLDAFLQGEGSKPKDLENLSKERDPLQPYKWISRYNITKVKTGEQDIEDPYETLKAYGMAEKITAGTKIRRKLSSWEDSIKGLLGGFFSTDRTGRTLGFQNADTGAKKLANGLLNASDLLGGPFFAAIELGTMAIQLWQGEFNKYCESLKKAEDDLKEAYSNWNSAEDSLRRTYQEGNPDASEEEIDQMIYDTYSTMQEDMAKAVANGGDEWVKKLNTEAEKGTELEYDEEKADGSRKEKEEEELSTQEEYQKAIKENTGALYAATAQLNVALSKISGKMTDSWWGVDGWTGWLTDQWGGAMDQLFKGGSKFSDENEFLLTQSQADENYAGYTEMAGLMMEDFKDAGGNWIKGMRTMMGDDIEDLVQILPKSGQDWMYSLANSSTGIGSINPRDNAKIQASMKNDPKTWQKLAREYAKRDVNVKQGKSTEKNVKRISGLVSKLQSTLSNGFNETHIRQAAYLMQMQEMYQVAQNTMVPIMSTNTSLAGSTLLAANGISTKTGTTSQNAGGTWGTAQVISGLVAIIAKSKAKEVAWQTAYEADPNSTDLNGDGYDSTDKAIIELAQSTNSADEFAKEAAKRYNDGISSVYSAESAGGGAYGSKYRNPNLSSDSAEAKAPALFIAQVYEAAAKMTGYGYSADEANKFAQNAIKNLKGTESLADIYNTFGKNYTENPAFHQMLIDNYLNATEPDDGSGSGLGSGDGDKDKGDTGTRKERVDLVLCNRKTIPKLNVNLFKKPPSFTILNKNFKLRDVKINSEDKPKAIMAAIKNSFIDIQKRTDPKIIQDEDAVYDPAAATDGTNVPSGSAKTNTS